MTIRNRLLAAAGVAAALAGLAVILDPSLATGLSVQDVTITAIGALAILQGLRVLYLRRRTDLGGASPPDPESSPTMPTPGDRFDDLVASVSRLTSGRLGAVQSRERVRLRLESAAVETLMRRYGCSRADAAALVRDGAWTDDETAAAFLAGSDVVADGSGEDGANGVGAIDPPQPAVFVEPPESSDRRGLFESIRSRLQEAFGAGADFGRSARRTAVTVAAHADVLPEDDDEQ